MSFVECEILGVQELLKDLKGYEKESEAAINKAAKDTSNALRQDAINRLTTGDYIPSRAKRNKVKKQQGHGFAGLAGTIYNRVVASMERVVGTPSPYAPYIEFGTGDVVFTNSDFDDEAKRIASQYKGKGIRKVNIVGKSFLNWAAVNQRKKHEERIIENLNKINKT